MPIFAKGEEHKKHKRTQQAQKKILAPFVFCLVPLVLFPFWRFRSICAWQPGAAHAPYLFDGATILPLLDSQPSQGENR